MVNTWNVTASYDNTTYEQGSLIRISIVGDFVHDVPQTGQIGPGSFGLVAASGDKTTVNFGTATATWIVPTHEDVVIDPTIPIVDSSGRVWTIAADGKSITAVA